MSRTTIKTKDAPEPIGPYSQAILVGNTLFLSGQVALNPVTGKMENADITSEIIQVMKNLEAVLKEAGFYFTDVVKTTIFLKDLNDFNTVNEIYGASFTVHPPARETVEVSRLPRDAKVEISLIAIKA